MARTLRRPLGPSLVVLAALLFVASNLPVLAEGATPATPTVKLAQGTPLGNILTDEHGLTLYIFKKDKPGESVCMDACAKKWPPLSVSEGMQPVAGYQGKPRPRSPSSPPLRARPALRLSQVLDAR